MKKVEITSKNHPEIKIIAGWCNSFSSKLKGLMFVQSIQDNTGIILAENSESKINTAIHMLFMNFDITAVWINSDYQVVDVVLAKKWHLSYVPKKPAKFVLEISQNHIKDFEVNDQLIFSDEK